jgi:hypothetical protein
MKLMPSTYHVPAYEDGLIELHHSEGGFYSHLILRGWFIESHIMWGCEQPKYIGHGTGIVTRSHIAAVLTEQFGVGVWNPALVDYVFYALRTLRRCRRVADGKSVLIFKIYE